MPPSWFVEAREGVIYLARNVKVPRSAKTGQFVTKQYANSHKATTVVQTIRKGK